MLLSEAQMLDILYRAFFIKHQNGRASSLCPDKTISKKSKSLSLEPKQTDRSTGLSSVMKLAMFKQRIVKCQRTVNVIVQQIIYNSQSINELIYVIDNFKQQTQSSGISIRARVSCD